MLSKQHHYPCPVPTCTLMMLLCIMPCLFRCQKSANFSPHFEYLLNFTRTYCLYRRCKSANFAPHFEYLLDFAMVKGLITHTYCLFRCRKSANFAPHFEYLLDLALVEGLIVISFLLTQFLILFTGLSSDSWQCLRGKR